MAYVVATRRGTFEARESRSTEKGPRSRTLVSFRELDAEALRKAQARATRPLDLEQLRESALRVGAPVAPTEVDEAARKTLRLISRGSRTDPKLRRLLLDVLSREDAADGSSGNGAAVSDNARAASEWIGAEPAERGRALQDLLELADALPAHFRSPEISFPRLSSV